MSDQPPIWDRVQGTPKPVQGTPKRKPSTPKRKQGTPEPMQGTPERVQSAVSRPSGTTFMVREAGKNGTVEIRPDRIVRTIKKFVGKNDVVTIPVKAVTGVFHDRKALKTDDVTLTVGPTVYEWKVSKAQAMVDALNAAIYG